MVRAGRLNLAFLLLLLVPTLASAQKDNRYTREAEKYMGLAMTKATPEERTAQYQEALKHLREGMEKEGDNAKVWLMAGTVLASLGEAREADAAFTKAVELHPDYAADVRHERHSAWAEAFNAGVGAMDEQRYDEAIRLMENAQLLFQERPEALMNLGLLYANGGDPAKAEQAFRDAITSTSSELFESLTEEEKAQWLRFRDMAKVSVSQMQMTRGVNAFQAEDYETAFREFGESLVTNPQSRDAIFNQAQALWAQATSIEKSMETMPEADQPAAKQKVLEIYDRAEALAKRTLAMDPNNDALHAIVINAHRTRSEFTADSAAKDAHRQAALAALQAQDALVVLVDEVAVVPGPDGSVIQGKITNIKAEPGSTVRLRFTLIGIEGATVGEQEVTATVGAAEESRTFEARVVPTGEVAGWKYTIVS